MCAEALKFQVKFYSRVAFSNWYFQYNCCFHLRSITMAYTKVVETK